MQLSVKAHSSFENDSIKLVQTRHATGRHAPLEPHYLLRVIGNGRPKEQIMRTVIAILALAFLAIPASAESAKSFAPGHHAKGTHGQPGASYYAPGHEKKRMYMHSARGVAPGHMKKY
jgi:hypothetical protein